jgi:hypothetical protein
VSAKLAAKTAREALVNDAAEAEFAV